MTTEILEHPRLDKPVATAEVSPAPASTDLPSDVFGIPTDKLLRFTDLAADSGLVSARTERFLGLARQAVKFAPLIETLQTESEPSAEALEPYREVVREAFGPVALAEKVAAKLGDRVSGALDKRLNAKIVASTEQATRKTSEKIKQHLEDAQAIAAFDNPQEQFTIEMSRLSKTVGAAIRHERNQRAAGMASKQEAPIPGFKGVVVRAVQKVKGFFKRLFGKPAPQTEITAYDAGLGIESVLKQFREQPEAMGSLDKYPLINRFVQRVLPKTSKFYSDYYAVAAEEILNFIYSGARPEDKDKEILGSVQRNPHDLRFLTRYGSFAERLGKIGRASHMLLPALKNILPADNTKLLDTLHKAQVFFHPKPVCIPEETKKAEHSAAEPEQKRIKAFIGKLKRKSKA